MSETAMPGPDKLQRLATAITRLEDYFQFSEVSLAQAGNTRASSAASALNGHLFLFSLYPSNRIPRGRCSRPYSNIRLRICLWYSRVESGLSAREHVNEKSAYDADDADDASTGVEEHALTSDD